MAEERTPPARRRLAILALAALLVGLGIAMSQLIRRGTLAAFTRPEAGTRLFVHEFALFGTYARLSFWTTADVDGLAADKIAADLQKLHDTINIFDPHSEISRLNQSAAAAPFPCSLKLWYLLRECRRAYQETGGVFDISVGPLMRLWGLHQARQSLPTAAEIEDTLQAVGLNKVVFDDVNRTVRFTHPKTCLDFGGIAKGYALDRAVRIARTCGVRSGLIDLGGNLFCFEVPPPGKHAYAVGIRDPFGPDDILGTVPLKDCAVSTSGNYERQIVIEKQTIGHIMDPRTGYPVEGVAGVTLICKTAVETEGMSKTLFVLGIKQAEPILAGLPDCHALFVPDEQPIRIVITRGFARFFTPDPAFADKVTVIGK